MKLGSITLDVISKGNIIVMSIQLALQEPQKDFMLLVNLLYILRAQGLAGLEIAFLVFSYRFVHRSHFLRNVHEPVMCTLGYRDDSLVE